MRLNFLHRLSAITVLLLAMLGIGFFRNEYLLLWQQQEFYAVERESISSGEGFTLLQLPGLLLYASFYLLCNGAILWFYNRQKKWWQQMIMFYAGAATLGLLLLILHVLVYLPPLVSFAQTVKEVMLSPLPVLMFVPFIYWQLYDRKIS